MTELDLRRTKQLLAVARYEILRLREELLDALRRNGALQRDLDDARGWRGPKKAARR